MKVGREMEFPILIKASDSYRNILPKGGRQEVLMSAEYLLDGKGYRVVGTVKKSLFGKIKDYNFLDFVVVDEKGNVVMDKDLSKRIFFCFGTLSYMYVSRKHILSSLLDNPSYFLTVTNRYDEFVERVKPVLKNFRYPEEYFLNQLQAFYTFLLNANQTNVDADKLARLLNPILQRAIRNEPAVIEEVEGYKSILQEFIQVSHQRTLLVLKNKKVFTDMKYIINGSLSRKEIKLDDLTNEVHLIQEIIKGVNQAIDTTMIESAVEYKTKTIEENIQKIESLWNKGSMLEDLSEQQFNLQWFYGKGVKNY
jgi:hypothetical protein